MPLLIAIFLFPFVEIAGFIIVGRAIGVLPTLGLIILTAMIGAALLRIQGFGVLQRLNTDVNDNEDPGRDLIHGAMIVIAGILLLIPGFVTDILGFLLFIPPIRDLVWKYMSRNVMSVSERTVYFRSGGAGPGRGRGGPQPRRPGEGPKVVDLDSSDFSSSEPDPNSPWKDKSNGGSGDKPDHDDKRHN